MGIKQVGFERTLDRWRSEADERAFAATNLRSLAGHMRSTLGATDDVAVEWERVLKIGARCASESARNLRDIIREFEKKGEG